MDRIMEPETFWQAYSARLNQARNWDAYQNDTTWTKVVMEIAKKAYMEIAKKTCEQPKLGTHKEYYRIDMIGYRQEEPGVDGNWWFDVAYEHENRDTWNEELCKLCYVAADLRVVSSYYTKEQPIEEKLKECLDNLGKEKILRVPNSNSKWLFVFGPRLCCTDRPFKAFTIDEKLSVIPVTGSEEVIPDRWRQKA